MFKETDLNLFKQTICDSKMKLLWGCVVGTKKEPEAHGIGFY